MKKYNTLIIAYMILAILISSGILFRLFSFFVYSLTVKSSSEKKSSWGLYGLIIAISLLVIGFCIFIIYYHRIISKYYHQASEEYTQVEEENTNKKVISESKLLILTYVMIVNIRNINKNSYILYILFILFIHIF